MVLEPHALAHLRQAPVQEDDDDTQREYRPVRPGRLRLMRPDEISARLYETDDIHSAHMKPSLLAMNLFEVVTWMASACIRAGWTTPEALATGNIRPAKG